MHICYLCSEYPPAPHGGIGSFTQTLARALVRRGIQVSVVGAYSDEYAANDDDQGIPVIRISRRGLPIMRFLTNRRRLAEVLDRIHQKTTIDVVEGGELDLCGLNPSAPGLKLLRMHGGPHFFAAGSRPNLWKGLKERWAFHIADEICAVSRYVGETTRRLLGLGGRSIEVIPNPVDVETFAPSRLPVEEEGLIVFTGTLTERKGIRQLVQAMPRILAEVPHARLEAYGGEEISSSSRVPFLRVLEASVPPQMKTRIEWKGRVPRAALAAALQRASVAVYPSHMEAMPIGWLEGLACGKAVVASRTGPGPELIDDGITGLLADPHDPGSIAENVIRVLKDVAFRRRLGAAARAAAVERYSLEKLADRNLAYYHGICCSQRIERQERVALGT